MDSLDKTPRKFQVADDVKDAWITIPRQKLGSVFLFKSENGEVRALQTVCPHAGCAIEAATKKNPQNGQEQLMFYCPCHAAHFDLAGVKLDGVSPRDLDTLETKIEDGKVFVRFQNFLTGIAEKKATG